MVLKRTASDLLLLGIGQRYAPYHNVFEIRRVVDVFSIKKFGWMGHTWRISHSAE